MGQRKGVRCAMTGVNAGLPAPISGLSQTTVRLSSGGLKTDVVVKSLVVTTELIKNTFIVSELQFLFQEVFG